MIEATGIKALAVHCRYRDERPREPGHWDRFKEIVDAVSIPVIANGDIKEYADMARIRELSGKQEVNIFWYSLLCAVILSTHFCLVWFSNFYCRAFTNE